MKILIIMGSPRKAGNGKAIIDKMEKSLLGSAGTDVERIYLEDENIHMCLGCQACYCKGEAYCPLKDGVIGIRDKIAAADGVIFYSPTYIVNISGLIKNFFDRLSYVCHRPMFYGRPAVLVTTTGSDGGNTALKSLKWPVLAWGFRVVGAVDVRMSAYNLKGGYAESIDKSISGLAGKLCGAVAGKKAMNPGIIELAGFRIRKDRFLKGMGYHEFDKKYWEGQGWLDKKADFFYPVKIGFLKKLLSRIAARALSIVM
jgi:multimeric flavodoxin WrbA